MAKYRFRATYEGECEADSKSEALALAHEITADNVGCMDISVQDGDETSESENFVRRIIDSLGRVRVLGTGSHKGSPHHIGLELWIESPEIDDKGSRADLAKFLNEALLRTGMQGGKRGPTKELGLANTGERGRPGIERQLGGGSLK